MAKSGGDTLTTIMPDFAKFLLQTPPEQRHGPVFRPMMPGGMAGYDQAGKMVSLIGELAGVVSSHPPQNGEGQVCLLPMTCGGHLVPDGQRWSVHPNCKT